MPKLVLPQGSRLTKQRQMILNDLRKVRRHWTAEEVYHSVKKKLRNISLGTVYRNLKFLQRQGYIHGISSPAYEAERFEGFIDHQEHFICRQCQRIFDFKKNLILPKKFTKLYRGNKIEDCQLNLIGLCQKCLKKNNLK